MNDFIKNCTKYQRVIWYLIFIQALIATLGSLYYSTFGDPVANLLNGSFINVGGGFMPCLLCWFARILMYPIVLISGVGIFKGDRDFTTYVLPLSIPGIFLEIYHYALQKLPIETLIPCTSGNPCSAMQVNYLGFITIPFLCLVAFVIITILAIINIRINRTK